jgi:ATP-dependent Clp protease ATP-binding subunit ClpX
MEECELEFSDESLWEIARIAKERDTGARGLRAVIENVMTEIMYELPEQERGQKFEVTPGVIRGVEKLFRPKEESAAA